MNSDEEIDDNDANNKLISEIFKKPDLEDVNLTNLKTILKQNEIEGNIFSYQSKMIDNVLNFKYITATDIMTHRIDILAVEETASVLDVINLSSKSGFSRIPVFRQNIDTIVGVVFVKDLLKLIAKPSPSKTKIKPFIHDLLYVPKTIKCFDLFRELTKAHKHLAVVVDDFGGTFGLVSMEDIIETIFGQIQDEFDNEVEEIKKINDKTFIMQGFANLKDVCDILNLEIDQTLSSETLSGFLINLLGHIPEPTKQLTLNYKNIDFSILAMEKHHIAKVKVVKATS